MVDVVPMNEAHPQIKLAQADNLDGYRTEKPPGGGGSGPRGGKGDTGVTHLDMTPINATGQKPGVEDPDQIRNDVLFNAKSDVGKQLWADSPFANITGKTLAGATTVSEVLKQAGINVDSATVKGVVDQLEDPKTNGWVKKPLSEAQPGDVYVHMNGFDQNVGIIGTDGMLLSNNSRSGIWSERQLSASRTSPTDFVLSPPPKK